MSARKIFSAIVYVLRTGCQWKALPKEFGSASAIHQHFKQWHRAGFFLASWRSGLAEDDEMENIAWDWQSIDGALVKAPLAIEWVGANPMWRIIDRVTNRRKGHRQVNFIRAATEERLDGLPTKAQGQNCVQRGAPAPAHFQTQEPTSKPL